MASPGPDPALAAIAAELQQERSGRPLPSNAVLEAAELARSLLFPHLGGPADVGAALARIRDVVVGEALRAYDFRCGEPPGCGGCREKAASAAAGFVAALPRVRRFLAGDVQAAYEGDPAATSHAETVVCYPGVLALSFHRLAHELHALEVPLLPRMIAEHAHSRTGIDIHPGARIKERFFIDHGTGVVIGETATIGSDVRLYQGVTLGAKGVKRDADGKPVRGIKRHPDVEDGTVIYAGATVLGAITVGRGSVIGANAWLTRSVPPGSTVLGAALQRPRRASRTG